MVVISASAARQEVWTSYNQLPDLLFFRFIWPSDSSRKQQREKLFALTGMNEWGISQLISAHHQPLREPWKQLRSLSINLPVPDHHAASLEPVFTLFTPATEFTNLQEQSSTLHSTIVLPAFSILQSTSIVIITIPASNEPLRISPDSRPAEPFLFHSAHPLYAVSSRTTSSPFFNTITMSAQVNKGE